MPSYAIQHSAQFSMSPGTLHSLKAEQNQLQTNYQNAVRKIVNALTDKCQGLQRNVQILRTQQNVLKDMLSKVKDPQNYNAKVIHSIDKQFDLKILNESFEVLAENLGFVSKLTSQKTDDCQT